MVLGGEVTSVVASALTTVQTSGPDSFLLVSDVLSRGFTLLRIRIAECVSFVHDCVSSLDLGTLPDYQQGALSLVKSKCSTRGIYESGLSPIETLPEDRYLQCCHSFYNYVIT